MAGALPKTLNTNDGAPGAATPDDAGRVPGAGAALTSSKRAGVHGRLRIRAYLIAQSLTRLQGLWRDNAILDNAMCGSRLQPMMSGLLNVSRTRSALPRNLGRNETMPAIASRPG